MIHNRIDCGQYGSFMYQLKSPAAYLLLGGSYFYKLGLKNSSGESKNPCIEPSAKIAIARESKNSIS